MYLLQQVLSKYTWSLSITVSRLTNALNNFLIPHTKTNHHINSFFPWAIQLKNNVLTEIMDNQTEPSFTSGLLSFIKIILLIRFACTFVFNLARKHVIRWMVAVSDSFWWLCLHVYSCMQVQGKTWMVDTTELSLAYSHTRKNYTN